MNRSENREAGASSHPPVSRLSIIIPTLNEAPFIRHTIERCQALRPAPEIIVCDGGSSDATLNLLEALGTRVIRSAQRGRSFQMNAGAQAATGDVLVFLHADSNIGQAAWETLLHDLENSAIGFGAFKRRFDPPSRLLHLGSYLAAWRGRVSKIFLGDQVIFARRPVFESAGGYREILLFEDVDLCLRLRTIAKGALIDAFITTSRRRFQKEGNAQRYFRNIILWLRYWFGADPNHLARVYYPGYFDPRISPAVPTPGKHPAPEMQPKAK